MTMTEINRFADLGDELGPLPNIWGEGALFAYSGLDGPTDAASGFVLTYDAEPYDLLIHTPQRRRLRLRMPAPLVTRLALNDAVVIAGAQGDLALTFAAWHTVIGQLPPDATMALEDVDQGPNSTQLGSALALSIASDNSDTLALCRDGDRFALSYGRKAPLAIKRAQAGLTADLRARLNAILDAYDALPHLVDPQRQRLLRKCFSVMRVNALAAEGAIAQHWSTPDRVPHKDMWLWDSVFQSLPMNRINPRAAWAYLKSVLDAQKPDGLIPHRMAPSGDTSAITQPPLLAWAVWENYGALGDKACLAYALPRLAAYLQWDLDHRDADGNHLLEWFIQGDVRCRSGESGLDNSPRFDAAIALDAVDFSVFAAQDMGYVSRIAAELGDQDMAQRWADRAAATSRAVHQHLWDADARFYFDRRLDTGQLSPVAAVTGFMPLLLEDLPPDRLAPLLDWLQDPAHFASAMPLPSVSLSDPEWCTDMWRGATWLNLNYLVIRGLRRQGANDAAQRLANASIYYVNKYYERFGVLFEFYDAADQRPPTRCDRKGPHQAPYDIRLKMDAIRDYHWTAAVIAELLLTD